MARRQRQPPRPVSVVPALLLTVGYFAGAILSAGSDGPPPPTRVAVSMFVLAGPGLVTLLARWIRKTLSHADLFLSAIPLSLMIGYVASAQMAQQVIRENLGAHECYLRQCAVCEWSRRSKVPLSVRKDVIQSMNKDGRFSPPSPYGPPPSPRSPAPEMCRFFVDGKRISCRVHGRPQVLSAGSRTLTLPCTVPVVLPPEVVAR